MCALVGLAHSLSFKSDDCSAFLMNKCPVPTKHYSLFTLNFKWHP